MMKSKSIPSNGLDRVILDMGIRNTLKACRLMTLRLAPPLINMWHILKLEMVGVTSKGRIPAPTMLDRQSMVPKETGVDIYLM
jgi:hypothetical protein